MAKRASVTLYRPVGPRELALIRDSDFREFPPRLPEQPVFYPVLTREYAEQIARDWNAKDKSTGYSGFVTRFEVDASYLSRYEPKRVGSSIHLEYWIPAGDLPEFNRHIFGRIEIIAEYHGVPDGAA
jgi:hypothetical protein